MDDELTLEELVALQIPPLFRWQHLNRDLVIGLIGDRGDGKSTSGAVIATLDNMMQGEPCFSNMSISVEIECDAEVTKEYGLEPGIVKYESRHLNMDKFLKFDAEYRGGVFFIDEINIALADARRAMSSQNLAADDVGQQLRKLNSGLIYTCIHEMFVDWRIRDMTDIFITCRDTALSPEGLQRRQTPGEEISWQIMPMSRRLTGEKYSETGESLGPYYLRLRQFWNIINTWQRQSRTLTAGRVKAGELNILESPIVVAHKGKWAWLMDKLVGLHNAGFTSVSEQELDVEASQRGISRHDLERELYRMGLDAVNGLCPVPEFDLDRLVPSGA